MLSKSKQWILWAIAMTIFLLLSLGGHTILLGMTIIAVAKFWYSVVLQARSEDNRSRR